MVDYIPPFMTERDEVAVRDCGGSSGLMLANKATLGIYPTTKEEREALLRAAGTLESHEGVSVLTLRSGMAKFFGWTPSIFQGTGQEMLTALRPGIGAAVFGYYSKLPNHFQRFDPGFAAKGDASYHVMYVQRGFSGALRVLDPLHSPDTSYQGEQIPSSALVAFATGYGSPARMLYALEGSRAGTSAGPQDPVDIMPDTDLSGNLYYGIVAKMPEGVPILDNPGGAEVAKTTVNEALGLIGQTRDSLWCLVAYHDRLRFVEKAKVGEFRPRTPPILATGDAFECPPPAADDTPFSQTDLDAKVAAEHERTRQAAITAVEAI